MHSFCAALVSFHLNERTVNGIHVRCQAFSTILFPLFACMEEFLACVNDYKHVLETHGNINLAKHEENVLQCGKQFIASLANVRDKDVFVKVHQCALYKVHDILVGRFSKLYRSPSTSIRSMHDRIFVTLGIKHPAQRFNFIATQIYERFACGVFIFNGEVHDQPSYHRLESCGAKDVPFTLKFDEETHSEDVT